MLPEEEYWVPLVSTAPTTVACSSYEHLLILTTTYFGPSMREKSTWDSFDDNDAVSSNLLAEKNRLHSAYINRPTDDNKAAFYRSRCLVQQRQWETQDDRTTRKTEETQGFADRKKELLRCDQSRLRGVLNRLSTISDTAIARLLQVDTNADLDFPPSLHETIRAVQQLSSEKAAGSDAIPAEIYKHGGPQLMYHLRALYQRHTNAQHSPTCLRFQRTFRAPIGLIGHLANCSTRTTPAAVS
ncbi:hypothetical protein SprV_0401534600 [Sparganum proliferum]